MKTTVTKVSLKDIAPQLRQILDVLRGLDERAGALSENSWLHQAINVMRGPGRERDRRRELEAAEKQFERDQIEVEKAYSRLVGRDVPVDRARINRTRIALENLLRECGTSNI